MYTDKHLLCQALKTSWQTKQNSGTMKYVKNFNVANCPNREIKILTRKTSYTVLCHLTSHIPQLLLGDYYFVIWRHTSQEEMICKICKEMSLFLQDLQAMQVHLARTCSVLARILHFISPRDHTSLQLILGVHYFVIWCHTSLLTLCTFCIWQVTKYVWKE